MLKKELLFEIEEILKRFLIFSRDIWLSELKRFVWYWLVSLLKTVLKEFLIICEFEFKEKSTNFVTPLLSSKDSNAARLAFKEV